MLRIFHIADVHLGLTFRNHPEASDSLVNARYDTLGRLTTLANEREADILAIAGDLFDKTGMKVSEIHRAAEKISRFEGKVVLVLPGNHDYITPESALWDRFRNEAGDHVRVLTRKAAVDLTDYGLDAVVYPAPCHAKHSPENAVGWVKNAHKPSGKIHIGMAHGSIGGVSPDFDGQYFPMEVDELQDAGVNIWLMGHTHKTWPEIPGQKDTIFNPGTPEPDGFNCHHGGQAFLHVIDENKTIRTEVLETGQHRFLRLERVLNSPGDCRKLAVEFSGGEYQSSVVRLTVSGRLDPEVYDEWLEIRNGIRRDCLELKMEDAGLKRKVTGEQIRNEFTEGSFPERLLSSIPEEEEDELQMAYELIREVKR